MFERFSDASRRVVVLAQNEARWLDHDYVGTEHLLLGVLDQGESPVARLLADLGVTDDAARRAVADHVGLGEKPAGDEIAFSPRAKAAIEVAFRTARRRVTQVEPSHLLLGVLSQEGARAGRILQVLGVEPEELRLTLAAEVGATPRFPAALEDIQAAVALSMRWPHWSPLTRRVGGLEVLDRVSDAALCALGVARREAQRLGQRSVSPEFLGLGLLTAGGEARERLIAAGARVQAARQALEAIFLPAEAILDEELRLDETVRWALGHPGRSRDPAMTSSTDVLSALLARSAGVWLLLHVAGADPARLRQLTSGS